MLWTKSAVGMPDGESGKEFAPTFKHLISMFDIDGDGPKEIVIIGSSNESFKYDSLYCFNSDGILRWRIGGGEPVLFGTQEYTLHGR